MIKLISLFFLTMYGFLGLSHLSFASTALSLDNAMFTADNSQTPPSFITSHHITLPHKWDASVHQSGWYQLQFDIPHVQQRSYAIYLPSVNMNAEVFLNGELVGSGGSIVAPIARHWHEPLIFTLPHHRLQTGINTLHVHVVTPWPALFGHLGQVSIGLHDELYPIYKWYYFEKQTIYLLSILLSLLIGLLLLYLWGLQKQHEFLWLALSCFVWGISSLDIILTTLPFPISIWQPLIWWLIGWMPVTLAFFLYSIMKIKLGILSKVVAFAGVLFLFITWVLPISMLHSITLVWFCITMLFGLHTIILLYKNREKVRRQNPAMFRLLFVSIGICYIFAIHDFLFFIDLLDSSSRLWLGFAIPTMLIAIAILLVKQFAQAMQDIEKVNHTLQSQIKAAEQKIKDDYKVIAELEKANAVDKERSRIFGDLHDDLGAKLLSLVYKSETDEQKHLAKQAMEGLREIVKYNPAKASRNIAPLLTWRKECQQRALEHHAQLQWHQTRISDTYSLPETTTIQLSMVLREALSNALKHGDGKQIRVRIQLRFGHLFMSVHNRGKLFTEASTTGRGKHTMTQRIQSLGGIIRWKGKKDGGCHVSWAVPLMKGG